MHCKQRARTQRRRGSTAQNAEDTRARACVHAVGARVAGNAEQQVARRALVHGCVHGCRLCSAGTAARDRSLQQRSAHHSCLSVTAHASMACRRGTSGALARRDMPCVGLRFPPACAWLRERRRHGAASLRVQRHGRERGLSRFPISPSNSLCLLYTSPSPRDRTRSRMPSSA